MEYLVVHIAREY